MGDARDLLVEAVSLLGPRLAPDKAPKPSAAFDILCVHVAITGAHPELSLSDNKLAFLARPHLQMHQPRSRSAAIHQPGALVAGVQRSRHVLV